MGVLKVYSGGCCLCDVGMKTNRTDAFGNPLYTGDIVLVYSAKYPGTDDETWEQTGTLTAVVSDQYRSFSNGHVEIGNANPKPFVMGIISAGFNDPQWRIVRVKAFSDVVEGERWPAYGFSYRSNDAADLAWSDLQPDERRADEIKYGLREEDLP